MGIPYYFASLIRAHKNLTSHAKGLVPDILAIDFNCLIHQYLQDDSPIESVIQAMKQIVNDICTPRKHLFIAMDGLVPYAKMVQQRYRRFRISEQAVFDRNQISPCTPYMKSLEAAVRVAFPNAIVSATDVPGEGEHKLFTWLKTLPPQTRRSIVVYGLDADLILLCLSQKDLSYTGCFSLLRENTAFHSKEGGFTSLNVWKLAETIEIPVPQYIAMCVLCFGNDFMPALGMFSLREDGHSRALSYVKKLGVDMTTREGRAKFLKHAAAHETAELTVKIKKRNLVFEMMVLGNLVPRYATHVLECQDAEKISSAFWKTFQWTLAYFTTNEVPDWEWVYPYRDAPLIQTLSAERTFVMDSSCNYSVTNQLQFILPSRSLRVCKKLVKFADEYYEEKDIPVPWMKKFPWEGKPRVSLPWSPTPNASPVIHDFGGVA